MRKIGFIGAFDKSNFIIYTAKLLEQLNYKILLVDATSTQKLKYIVPSINPTKAYITSMSRAINIELKMKKINVTVSALCASAVDTNFNVDLGVTYFFPPSSSEKVAKYGVDKMLKGKEIIVPGFLGKITYILNKIIPVRISKYFIYLSQNGKRNY